MLDKHIELVKKWLADSESVSLQELKDNAAASYAADAVTCASASADADAACAAANAAAYAAAYAANAADAAAYAANAADAAYAEYWVKKFEELTNAR